MITLMRKYLWPAFLVLSTVTFLFSGACGVLAEELEPIKLSAPRLEKGKLLMEALSERQSSRSFSSEPLPIEVLSDLLWAAFGVNRPDSGRRTAPSARNWQEIDIYVAMEKGLYLYDAGQNVLQPVLAQDIRAACGLQAFTQIAPVDLIFVADLSKMSGDKTITDFYSATDTGFISQNVYLFCASEGLSTVVLGWVDRIRLAEVMGLKENQKIVLTQPVGYAE
ncbi:MAG: SagB/ThcOx family dehydrogenase [Candidatus Omnitrophica bacterium]|nr:SagB/ThcOx family dehydrogenase [Candidatus Omnitrophota bacterium]